MKKLVLLCFGAFTISSLVASEWSADVGIGSLLVPGAWTPLRLTAPADAGPWSAEVSSITTSGREAPPVVFNRPTGGSFEESIFLSDATRSLRVKFSAQGTQDEVELKLAGRLFPGHLVGVSGVDVSTQGALSELLMPKEPVRVVSVPPSRWPVAALGFGGLAALVVKDPGAVLSPAQRTAVRAWIASGGRLAVTSPRESGSLLTQIGAVHGFGLAAAAPSNPDWGSLLELSPYGQVPRLGTVFEPAPLRLPKNGRPDTSSAIVFVIGWAALGALLLVMRKKARLGFALLYAAGCGVVVVVLWAAGSFAWDKGLPVHGREIVLPDQLGRFVSLEAARSVDVSGPFDWPEASPWALDLWKQNVEAGQSVRESDEGHIALAAFLPAVERHSRFRIRWDKALRWSEQRNGTWVEKEVAPAELAPDAPWLAKVASTHPGTTWAVGMDGMVCWLKPEIAGASL